MGEHSLRFASPIKKQSGEKLSTPVYEETDKPGLEQKGACHISASTAKGGMGAMPRECN